jgi:hypothetical protein
MARRVTVHTLCDPCLAMGSEVEAEELPPLNLVGNKPRTLALCEDHRKEVFDPLVQMVKDHGQILDIEPSASSGSGSAAPKRTAAKTAKAPAVTSSVGLECPECAEAGTPRSFTAPQGLGAHRYRAHGVESTKKAG